MKKLFSLFAALTLSAGLWAINNVPYIDADGQERHRDGVTGVISSTDPVTLNAGWYVVMPGSEKQTGTLVCQGEVHLIVYDGAKLTATGANNKPGIEVSGEGNSLTIYGYTNQSGQLIATGVMEAAGIGGGNGGNGSNITINGGKVTANGGTYGAGIGGGQGTNGSYITINGGEVTATGGSYAAGIGGGMYASGSNITINGGVVTANGGDMAAGIGGGVNGPGSNITINGGVVTANGGDMAAGIGGGVNGPGSNISVATSLVVKADGNNPPSTVIANTGADLAESLAGKRYATVEPAPAPVVGDKFVDETSGLKFEITAVGGTNTVKVIANDYTGTSYTIPATVSYQSVTFNVTEIGDEAFRDCSGLTSVTFLGKDCQNAIGEMAFMNVGDPDPALLTLPNSWTGTLPDEDGYWYGGKFELSEIPTALPTINANVNANKFFHNGQLIIERNGKNYNAVGQEVK